MEELENKENTNKNETNEKELNLEQKYKELENKYNILLKEKTEKDREMRHNDTYKKYNISEENINLLKRYLSNNDEIEEELMELNKNFPHLFNKNKETNINNSLNVKDYIKTENTENKEIETNKLGMVG